jgi:trans-aconitate methyltransferase
MSAKPYNWDSADYAKYSSAQYQWAQELIGKLRLQGTELLLDIGCGDGKASVALASRLPNGKVTGIDNSESMISLAKKRFPQSKYNNLTFCLMDATRLTFENQFDVAFSNATLHWVKDHLAVLKGVKKSLKKSGRLLFQMGGTGNAQDIIEVMNVLINKDSWKSYFKNYSFPYGFYGPEDYHGWFTQVGMKPIRLELIPKDMRHKGKDGLAGWIRTTWLPFTQRIPSHLRDRFITEVVDFYVQCFPADNQGDVHVKMIRLEVEAINF